MPGKIPPSIVAMLLQCVAVVVMLLLAGLMGLRVSLLSFALLCGLLAATFTLFAGLDKWWLLIQLIFLPGMVLMLAAELPPYVYLGAFLMLLASYWSVFHTQVPLYLSSNKAMHAMESLLPAENNHSLFSFMDLGSGSGGMLTHLARARPGGSYFGVEAAPLPYIWSRLRIRLGGYRNCNVRWGSLWDRDLTRYDVVFAYLSPVPMERLWRKASAEMRPGTLFISSTFAVPGQSPDEVVRVDGKHGADLFVWRM